MKEISKKFGIFFLTDCLKKNDEKTYLAITIMHKRLSCFIFLFAGCAFTFHATAQNQKIDSLENILKTAKEDTNTANSLNDLSRMLWQNGNFDGAIEYAGRSEKLSEKLSFQKGMATAYSNLGVANNYKGDYAEGLKNDSVAMKIFTAIGNKKGIANAYVNIGIVYNDRGNYPEALKNYFSALKIREEMKDNSAIANSYSNIGNTYLNMNNKEEALKNQLAALALKKTLGDKRGMAGSYQSIGSIYGDMGKNQAALENYEEALRIRIELDDQFGIASNYVNIATFYILDNKLEEAQTYLDKALPICKNLGDYNGEMGCYINEANISLSLKKYALANAQLQKALDISKEIRTPSGTRTAYRMLTSLDSATGNFKKAFEDYKFFIAYRDSMVNEENTKKVVQSEMQYDFDKKESQQKAAQDKKDAIADADKQRQKIILWFVVGGLLLVVIFCGFIYRSFLQKRKANVEITKQKLIVEDKQKEILDSIHYAKRIQQSLLPTEKYVERSLNKLRTKN